MVCTACLNAGASCEECYDSPTVVHFGDRKCTVHLLVKNSWHEACAYDLVLSWLGDRAFREIDEKAIPLKSITLTPKEGAPYWDAKLEYSYLKYVNPVEAKMTYDLTGEMEHVTWAPLVTSVSCTDRPVVDHQGMIGWNDGHWDGVDVIRPALKMSLTMYAPKGLVSPLYVKHVASFEGCSNLVPFFGFDAGEVLFVGATMTPEVITDPLTDEDGDFYLITFNFKCQTNADALPIAETTIAKDGWDYIWIKTGRIYDPAEGFSATVPLQADVNRVYPRADLARLIAPINAYWNGE